MGRNFRIVAGNIITYLYWKWNYFRSNMAQTTLSDVV